jgi:hypothetical protein
LGVRPQAIFEELAMSDLQLELASRLGGGQTASVSVIDAAPAADVQDASHHQWVARVAHVSVAALAVLAASILAVLIEMR